MTTITWDGRTLAGDRQATSGGTPTTTTKVFKVKCKKKKYLVGFSGRLADGQAFLRFVERGFQDNPAIDTLTAMVIHEDGRVVTYDDTNANPCDLGILKYWAAGSGADYALGAMAHGATATEAVLIASDLDVNTGRGVDKVSF
jgi:ATP-dependent protease HslVU (ClpYQ) peptidase subunit